MVSTEDEGSEDEFSVYDEWDDLECTTPPIVVGYAFGPKKMSTMGVVMAEASRTRLTSPATLLRQANFHGEASSSLLTPDSLRDHQKGSASVEIILEAGHDLRKVVRRFASSADSTTTSTGTRTASTISVTGGSSSGTNLFSSSHNKKLSSSMSSPSLTSPQQIPIRVSFVPLDPEIPLEEQHGGRIDVILHKLTEDILLSSQYEQQQRLASSEALDEDAMTHTMAAMRRVQRLCDFSSRHGCPLVDEPRRVQRLMNRALIAETLRACLQGVKSASGRSVATPKYAVLQPFSDNSEKIKRMQQVSQLQPPLMAKPLTAAGTKASHAMAVLLRADALLETDESTESSVLPSLVQEYVNHNSLLYKVYVLGDFCSVHKRRSLPNLPSHATSTKTRLAFDSQRPYPRLRDFGYTAENSSAASPSAHTTRDCSTTPVTAEEVQPIVAVLKAAFGLELFGFDVICSAADDTLLVIDVNYFPSYKEVPNFAALLAKYLTDRALERRVSEATKGLEKEHASV